MAIEIKNKKAEFQFFIVEEYVAGIQLQGTEIKSIRDGKASIMEAFCRFRGDELFVINMYVAEYEKGSYNNHEPRRERKLLLQRSELNRLKKKMKDVGITIIPTLLYFSDSGYAKLKIAVAKGKKLHDKREGLKEKEQKREMSRMDKRKSAD
jgi:SsrA-binding protein